MRELKFRGWANRGFVYFDVREDNDSNFHDFYSCCEVNTIEQYTGLKDKNGKEIYEGDIVKARWYRAKNARLDAKGEVKYDFGWFYIYDDPDGQDRLGAPIHNCYDIEIVGNIHEKEEEE